MKKTLLTLAALLLLCSLLPVGCAKGADTSSLPDGDGSQTSSVLIIEDKKELGDATKAKTITVLVDHGGPITTVTLHTDAKMLADALTESGLVQGEDGDYGLMILTVDGDTADYAKEKTWWKLCDAEGNMTPSGASSTEIKDGDTYQLILTKD